MTTPDPRMRAADADRQATVDRLTDHFTAGRLTASEYDERVRQAYASTYLDELPELLADLPEQDAGQATGAAGWAGDENPGWGGAGWAGDELPGWGAREGSRRGRPGWAAGPGGYRHRRPIAVLPVILVVALLIALTHGFILVPLFWLGLALLVFGRHRRGGCARRFGPRSAP